MKDFFIEKFNYVFVQNFWYVIFVLVIIAVILLIRFCVKTFKKWKNFIEFLDKNKIVIEIIAIIIAILAVWLPLRQAIEVNKLTQEALKESGKSNEIARNLLELTREEMQLNFIPFLSFGIKDDNDDLGNDYLFTLVVENFSDKPAIEFYVDLYIDNIFASRTNSTYGDIMPHQKRDQSLQIDINSKKKFFNGGAILDIDLVYKDVFGNIFHHKRGMQLDNNNTTFKYIQLNSNFCCEEKENNKCSINLNICQK